MKNITKISALLVWASLLAWTAMAADNQICTADYTPVCAEYQVQCFTTPCNPIQKTYGNKCTAEAANAKILYQGECKKTYDVSTNQWLVSRAFDNWITIYSDVSDFKINEYVTREQAAKMTMAVIDKSGVEERMIKQSAGACSRSDQNTINRSLVANVYRSCTKWLFYWSNGMFMPTKYFTDTDWMTVMNRISKFVPKLADFMSTAKYTATKNQPLTRWEFLDWLYSLYQIIYTDNTTINVTPITGDIFTWSSGMIMTWNTWMIVWNDSDIHWCKASAWYSRNTGLQQCVRPREINSWVVLSWTYYLTSYNNTGITNTWITISFANNTVSAKICNSINGSYSASGNVITFGPMMSTKMACMDSQITMLENNFNMISSLNYVYSSNWLVTTDLSGNIWTRTKTL